MVKCSIDLNGVSTNGLNIKTKGIKMFVNYMRGAINGGSNRK